MKDPIPFDPKVVDKLDRLCNRFGYDRQPIANLACLLFCWAPRPVSPASPRNTVGLPVEPPMTIVQLAGKTGEKIATLVRAAIEDFVEAKGGLLDRPDATVHDLEAPYARA